MGRTVSSAVFVEKSVTEDQEEEAIRSGTREISSEAGG